MKAATGLRLAASFGMKSPATLSHLSPAPYAAISRELSSTTTSTDLLISKSEGLMTIQVNRPSKLNAITQGMYVGIADALESAKRGANVQMVL